MRLFSFRRDGPRFGILRPDGLTHDLTGQCGPGIDDPVAALAHHGTAGLARIAATLPTGPRAADLHLLPPVPDPGKIICVGLNYRSHIAETGLTAPAAPLLFARFANSVTGHDQPLIRPKLSEQFDFEGELAVVIGRTARHVPPAEALSHVAGYSCFNDGSLRDLQLATSQFLPGKICWQSGSFGPWLVTADAIPDPTQLRLETRLNGTVVQSARLDDLLFDIPTLIAHLSALTVLDPGDVIVTGTTGGVGMARTPPLWMRAGDRVEVEIDGIGILANTVQDEA